MTQESEIKDQTIQEDEGDAFADAFNNSFTLSDQKDTDFAEKDKIS